MRIIALFLVPLLIAIAVIGGFLFYFSKNEGKGALQVTSQPKSQVYLNGKLLGETPFCKCETSEMLPTGEYTLKLVPKEQGFTPFENKVTITKSILTVVDRTFGQGADSEGSIISLSPLDNKKAAEILVVSFPESADVFVDTNAVGTTPLLLKNQTISDHEVKVKKDGYKEKTVRIRTVEGYKLNSLIFLGINPNVIDLSPTPTPTASPAASVTPGPSGTTKPTVLILQTPTGFLRVRDQASLSGAEIARVTPGETLELVSEVQGWFEIKLKDGKTTGYISTQYAQKQ